MSVSSGLAATWSDMAFFVSRAPSGRGNCWVFRIRAGNKGADASSNRPLDVMIEAIIGISGYLIPGPEGATHDTGWHPPHFEKTLVSNVSQCLNVSTSQIHHLRQTHH